MATEAALIEHDSEINIKFTDGNTSSIRISNKYGIEVRVHIEKYALDWSEVKYIRFEQHKDMKLFVISSLLGEEQGKRIELGYVTEATAQRIIEEVGSQAKVFNQ